MFVILSLPSYAEDDVSSPNNAFLRSEIGMHSAAIKSIDVDAEERYLVTGSLDKTVRVWSLADKGSPVQILRPPIGKGREGEIHAVAISPDGDTIATGGWTGQSYDNIYSIYLFDRQSGEMTKCISGHPSLIFHLTYSPDGRYLVASLAQGGIRVYQTSDYHLQAQDTAYEKASYWADFDSQGRLVTSSWDGLLRLYDKDFKLLTKNSAPGGNQPVAVDFSPTDDKIAVGFADSSDVSILSGEDLSPITDLVTDHEPQVLGANGSLSAVTWSKDGQWLYAGGQHQHIHLQFWETYILRWQQGEQERTYYEKWPAASNTILDIRGLKDGGIIFSTFDPSFGRFNATGDKLWEKTVDIADFRRSDIGIRVSQGGGEVEFNYRQDGENQRRRFSVHERIAAALPEENPQPSATSSTISFHLMGHLNMTDFKINGMSPPLRPHELVRSVAYAPNGESILVGADWSLQLLDKQLNPKWQVEVSAIPWDMGISGNGELAVVGFSDGILRWYRLSDGAELLSYFPYGESWILSTPKGHYMASSGGENFMGWYTNQGPAKVARFFPLSKFRSRFYRPEVVAATLIFRDVDKAITSASEVAGLKQSLRKAMKGSYSPEFGGEFMDGLALDTSPPTVAEEETTSTTQAAEKRTLAQEQTTAISEGEDGDKTAATKSKPTLRKSLPPEIVMLALVEPEPEKAFASRGISGVVSRGVSGVESRDTEKAIFSKPEVELRYQLHLPTSEPITGLNVLVDERPVAKIASGNGKASSNDLCDLSQQTRGISNVASRGISNVASRDVSVPANCPLPQDEDVHHLRISLPSRDVKVGLSVQNRFATADPLEIELKWKGEKEETPQPNLYVLAIGVSNYDNKELTLNFAAKDANDFANALKDQEGKLYKTVTIKQHPDATKEEVLAGLEWLRSQVQFDDVAMLFLAGHGVNVGGHDSGGSDESPAPTEEDVPAAAKPEPAGACPATPQNKGDKKSGYYFVPRDAKVKTETEITESCVSFQDIKRTVLNLSGTVLFFLDTCHSGNVMGDGLIDVTDVANGVEGADRKGVVVLTATTGEQLALESPDWGNGAFTKKLLEALKGKADVKGDKTVSFKELDLYLSDGVEELTDTRQTPTVVIPKAVKNFSITSVQ